MKSFINNFGLFKYRELLAELVKREIKARYKQSILGYAWVILVPLINLVVMSVVFSVFLRIPTGDIPYPIFLFAGLVPWLFTANAITSATKSLVSNSTLITKISLPREVFPISAVITKTIDLLFSVVILVVLIMIFGLGVKLTWIIVPFIFVIHFLLVLGVSLILSSLNVFYRDVENVIGVMLVIWMYLTPIVYPIGIVPEKFKVLILLNPMTPIIGAYRSLLLMGEIPAIGPMIYSSVFSIVLFLLGYVYFKKKSGYFADVI